jgi:hypothetical protein
MSSWRACASGLVSAAMITLGCGWGAMAQPPGASSDPRLLDPTTVGQTAQTIKPGVAAPTKVKATGKGHARKGGAAEHGSSSAAARYFDGRLPTHGADRHIISAVPKRSAEADAPATRPSLGAFSLGVETDTNYKPRTPFNPDASETGYDATYVPHRLTVPFIGFSATSILPP